MEGRDARWSRRHPCPSLFRTRHLLAMPTWVPELRDELLVGTDGIATRSRYVRSALAGHTHVGTRELRDEMLVGPGGIAARPNTGPDTCLPCPRGALN